MTVTKLSDLRSSTEIAEDEMRDPAVAAELERTSVAETRWFSSARDPKDRYWPASSIAGDG